MPVDTKAVAYEWYFDVPEDLRVIKMRWEPEDGVITSSMGLGHLALLTKNKAEDEVWTERHRHVDVMWVVAESTARRDGLVVEVPIYA